MLAGIGDVGLNADARVELANSSVSYVRSCCNRLYHSNAGMRSDNKMQAW